MSKIEELTKQLVAELEAQNYKVNPVGDEVGHFDIWLYKGKLTVERIGSWEIECGEVAI